MSSVAGRLSRLFALARSKLTSSALDDPRAAQGGDHTRDTIHQRIALAARDGNASALADAYRDLSAVVPDDAEVLETAARLALKCGRIADAREVLGTRGATLGLHLVQEALIDPERAQRDEGAYVAVLKDVLVESCDWSILDDDKVYTYEAHSRTLTKSPWVEYRSSPARDHHLFKLPPPARIIEEPCVYLGGDANYAHWVERNLLKLALIEGTEHANLPLLLNEDPLPHQREYLAMLGIADERLIGVPPASVVHCRELVVPTNLVYSPRLAIGVHWIRRKLAAWMDSGPPRELVYLSRRARIRQVSNEQELEDQLRDLGFGIYSPGQQNVKDQIRIVSGARVIVAPHGATLANLVFASPGATLLELNSVAKSYFTDFALLAEAVGLKHEVLLSVDYDPSGPEPAKADADYRVDIAEVVRTLREIEPGLFT